MKKIIIKVMLGASVKSEPGAHLTMRGCEWLMYKKVPAEYVIEGRSITVGQSEDSECKQRRKLMNANGYHFRTFIYTLTNTVIMSQLPHPSPLPITWPRHFRQDVVSTFLYLSLLVACLIKELNTVLLKYIEN